MDALDPQKPDLNAIGRPRTETGCAITQMSKRAGPRLVDTKGDLCRRA